jgi:hypothetical protein
LGNYYNTFSNKSLFYTASPSYPNSYSVFPSHQVGSRGERFFDNQEVTEGR